MPPTPIAGPYRILTLPDGSRAPWYILPFDRDGRAQAPRTRAALAQDLASGDYTDILLFSHGWNNDWKAASRLYTSFIDGYLNMLRGRNLAYSRPHRPLLIGVFWPSTALVMPWEAGPQFAAGTPAESPEALEARDEQADLEQRELQELAAALDPGVRERFYELADRETLSDAEAQELAAILAPVYAGDADELEGQVEAPSPDELLEAWRRAERTAAPDDTGAFGMIGGGTAGPSAGPAAAGILDTLNPRNLYRVATVYQMKDRAGRVGAVGVGPLLRFLLSNGRADARVHLLGHSYGCKVVLSALCSAGSLPRPVDSMLLLQPAVSALCFAADAGNGRPGGYVEAPRRVSQPILTSYSRHDFPLTQVFHLAVRRPSDLGEARIAGAPPGRYAALGGFGPAGADEVTERIDMPAAGERYPDVPGDRRIVALRGDAWIAGHGDVSNEATWWALYQQLRA
jgi:hypothetical protein